MRVAYVIWALLAVSACTDSPVVPERQNDETGDSLYFLHRSREGNSGDTLNFIGATFQYDLWINYPLLTRVLLSGGSVVSRNPAVASVDESTPTIRAAGRGWTTIDASANGLFASRRILVRQVVKTVTVTPDVLDLLPGSSAPALGVAAVDSNNIDVDGTRTYSTADPLIATVDSFGVVTAMAPGSTSVHVLVHGPYIRHKGKSIEVRVGEKPADLLISPAADTLVYIGQTTQFTASATDALGNAMPISWRVLGRSRATVDNGLVTATGPGRARVIARAGIAEDTAEVVIRQAIETVHVALNRNVIEETDTTRGLATSFDSADAPSPRKARWRSRNHDVVTVNNEGVISAVHAGSTWVVGTNDDAADSAQITVVTAAAKSAFLEFPDLTYDSIAGYILPANGTTQTPISIKLLDGRGMPVHLGGDTLDVEVNGITANTSGGTISAVTDHGDGTYSAILTSPTDNGTTSVLVRHGGSLWTTRTVTYTGGNNVPQIPAQTFTNCNPCSPPDFRIDEDSHHNAIVLPGTDADGDVLSARIVEVDALSPVAVWETAAGIPLVAGNSYAPTDVFFTPHPDGFGPFYARIYYILTDGKAESDVAMAEVHVTGINDPPRPTLASTLNYYEDTQPVFLMGGHDPEGNIYRVRYTIRPDNFGGGFYYISPSGDELITPATTALDNSSDISFGWPIRFVPGPNDYGVGADHFWDSFCYVLEEIPSGFTGPENCVTVNVLPVNDPPELDITGIGKAQNHDLTTSLIQGGTYSLPAVAVTDDDINEGPEPQDTSEFAVRIENSGDGILDLETFDYEDALVVFNKTDHVITFKMRFDVTSSGFRPDLTLNALLSNLKFQAGSGTSDTLTITIDDQGAVGVCSSDDHTDPCPKQSVTTIGITTAPGTPPDGAPTMVLAPAGS